MRSQAPDDFGLMQEQVEAHEKPDDLSDHGNANYFLSCYGERIRYCKEEEVNGRWYVADEAKCWGVDREGQIYALAERAMLKKRDETLAKFAEKQWTEEEKRIVNHAQRSLNRHAIDNCVAIARYRENVRILPNTFDSDPWLLGVENGVLNLKTGKLEEPNLALLVARRAPVAVIDSASWTKWDEFLRKVQPDEDTRKYLQMFAGVCLTGEQPEQCFLFCHGTGANGKTVFIRALQAVLGPDYSWAAKKGLFFTGDRVHDAGDNDKADLAGRRLVTSSETVGQRWNIESIKEMTGGDSQNVRQLYTKGQNIVVKAKFLVAANREPHLDAFDEATRRRFVVVPWRVTIPEEDRIPLERYLAQLLEEKSGILNWARIGLLEFHANGGKLTPSKLVKEATEAYLTAEDHVKRFCDEWCEYKEGDIRTYVAELHEFFRYWSNEPDPKKVLGVRKFTIELKRILGTESLKPGNANKMTVLKYGLKDEARKMGEVIKQHWV